MKNNNTHMGKLIVPVVALCVFVVPAVSSATSTCTEITGYLAARSGWNTDSQTRGQVTTLQTFLISAGFLSGVPTGYFGSMTENAVKKMQASNGLVASGGPDTTGYGAIGPGTRALISRLSCGGAIASITATSTPGSTGSVVVPYTFSTTTAIQVSEKVIGVEATSYSYVTELSLSGGTPLSPVSRWTLHMFCPPDISITTSSGSACGEVLIAPTQNSPSGAVLSKRFYIRNRTGSSKSIPVTVFARNISNSLMGRATLELSVPSATTTLVTQSQVVVSSPNGGESFSAGKPIQVTWQTGGGIFNISSANRVEISFVGGGKSAIFKNLANDGVETVVLPSDLPTGSYKVRVSVIVADGSAVFDESDAVFTITAIPTTPTISIVTPKPMETWYVGKRNLVQWQGNNIPANSTVYVTLSSANGTRFGASTTPAIGFSLGSSAIDVPPLACMGPCSSTTTIPTQFGSPYSIQATLYGPVAGSSTISVLAQSSPVAVNVLPPDSVDQPTFTLKATEIAGNLGATIVSFDTTYYMSSGRIKVASTTLQLTCPTGTAVTLRLRYKAESVCGVVLPMNVINLGAAYRLVFEASNTGKTYLQIPVVTKTYDTSGQLVAVAQQVFSLKPTGPIASSPITFSQPSEGSQYTMASDIPVSWGGYSGDFDSYILEVGNIGSHAVSVSFPFIQKTETSVRVFAREIVQQVGFIAPGQPVAEQGYYFRVTAQRGNGQIASGMSGLFSIKPQVTVSASASFKEKIASITDILESVKQSLSGLLMLIR
jgi:peptidoglycan hydrolase-like protein with peptidoglycan-binding domain